MNTKASGSICLFYTLTCVTECGLPPAPFLYPSVCFDDSVLYPRAPLPVFALPKDSSKFVHKYLSLK